MPRRTSSADSTARRPDDRRGDGALVARHALETHWAVLALAVSERERARAVARRAWRRGVPRLRDERSVADAALVGRVAAAYEIAALAQADTLEEALRDLRAVGVGPVVPGVPDDVAPPELHDATAVAAGRRWGVPLGQVGGSGAPLEAQRHDALLAAARPRDVLRAAADAAFGLLRAAPLPRPWEAEHLPQLLRTLALGGLAGDGDALREWVARVRDARAERALVGGDAGGAGGAAGAAGAAVVALPPFLTTARWDAHLRDELAGIWLDLAPVLLAGEAPPDRVAVERAFERLARLRELAPVREAELLAGLPAELVTRMRAHVQVLSHVADATGFVVVWARRGRPLLGVPQATSVLEAATVLTAADRELDLALRWLTVALRVPFLTAGLPAPLGRGAPSGDA